MFRVVECVWVQHDHLVVSLAAAIWIVGSCAFFLALERSQECRSDRRAAWLWLGGLAGGLGVWATHFVAMLAYDGGMPISYAVGPTVLSALIPVLGFALALRTFSAQSPMRCVLAGVIASAGVAAMHFTGMAAVRAQARIHYDWAAVAASTAATVVLFGAAFRLFDRLSGPRRIAWAALGSVAAVCALHFTGMSATTLTFDPTLPPIHAATGREWLIGAIVGSTMVVVLLTAVSTLIDRYLTDLKGFAGATLEGILIVRDGRIVEANDRLAQWMGRLPSALIGLGPDSLLAAADGLPISALRDKPIEAVPRGTDTGLVFEVAVHEIEYRGRSSQVLAVRDLTAAKAAQRQIEQLARHDALTGLPNRTLLQERLDHALALGRRSGEPVALLTLDLDRFKAVNDLFGHGEGDRVLRTVAGILRRAARSADTVARIGGDEFVILAVGADQPDGAQALARRILDLFQEEMNPAMDPTAVGVSIGVAIFPQDADDAAGLHHAADVALYRAKFSGRGMAAFFDAQMDLETRQRRQLESDLRYAVARGQLHLTYQPWVQTADKTVTGYEALLRWTHPDHGEVPPDRFIQLAEDTGAILSIGEWVIRQACRDAAGWAEPLMLAVNVSAVQFQVATLEDIVVSALAESGLPAERLEIEITETAMMKDRAETVRVLLALKRRGVKVVMDDFGTGYSSLSNLQSFPFDKIKIDRSFIQPMEDDLAARSIIRAIVGIGKSLSLPIVAEGVETEDQLRILQEEGCSQAQGFLYGRPGPGPAVTPRSVSRDVA